MFDNHEKNFHVERSEELTKVTLKILEMPKWIIFKRVAVKQCYQIGHYKIGQKLMDNAKIQNSNVTF